MTTDDPTSVGLAGAEGSGGRDAVAPPRAVAGRSIREVLATLGVIASLVFVGLEVRQNTIAVRGATLQAISDTYTEFMVSYSLDPTYRGAECLVFGGASPSDLDDPQRTLMNSYVLAWIGMLENTYLQNRLGLVDDAVFDGYGWNRLFHRTPYFKEMWHRRAELFVTDEFREFFEARVQIGPGQ